MKRSIWGVILLAVLVVIGIYFAFDPTAEGWFPKCRFYQLTGYKCPGCGSQRMLHSLLHGDIVGAFRYNAYLMTLFPLLVGLLVFDSWQKWLPAKWAGVSHYVLAGALLVLTALWLVFRNAFGW